MKKITVKFQENIVPNSRTPLYGGWAVKDVVIELPKGFAVDAVNMGSVQDGVWRIAEYHTISTLPQIKSAGKRFVFWTNMGKGELRECPVDEFVS